MAKPDLATHRNIVTALLVVAIVLGYRGATIGGAGWRLPFSLHPLLMSLGYVGLMGFAHKTKKLGGYTNTKNHGLVASVGLILGFGGLYAIYSNKEAMGREHITSNHALVGIISLCGLIGPALAGAIFLHPDFGIDKPNKLIRKIHKLVGRFFTAMGWLAAVMGLAQMTESTFEVAAFAVPLGILAAYVLV